MNYLLSASLAMAVFYALYAVAFRRLRFHDLNRAYLLGSLALSLALPFSNRFPAFKPEAVGPETFRPRVEPPKPAPMPTDGRLLTASEPSPTEPDWALLGWSLYAAGAAFVGLRLGGQLLGIRQLARQDGDEIDDLLVVPTTGGSASFFRLVLLNDVGLAPDERAMVLAHEAEHARLRHSFDRLAVAVLAIPFWFNPVLWLYRRSLAHLHELQVDETVAGRFNRRAYAELLLKTGQPGFALANAFARQPLRDRLRCLFHPNPSSGMKKLWYLLLLPATGMVLWACQRDVLTTDEPTVPTGKVWVIDHPERLLGPITVILKTPVKLPGEVIVVRDGKVKNGEFKTTFYPVEPKSIRRITVENIPPVETDDGRMVAHISVETADTTYRYAATQWHLNDLIRDWVAANTHRLLTRISLRNDDWTAPYAFANGAFDCLIFKVLNPGSVRGYRSIDVATGKSPVFKLDDREVTEEELNRLSRGDITKIQSIGIDPGNVAALEYGERGTNGKVFFSTQLNGGVKAKRQPQLAKP